MTPLTLMIATMKSPMSARGTSRGTETRTTKTFWVISLTRRTWVAAHPRVRATTIVCGFLGFGTPTFTDHVASPSEAAAVCTTPFTAIPQTKFNNWAWPRNIFHADQVGGTGPLRQQDKICGGGAKPTNFPLVGTQRGCKGASGISVFVSFRSLDLSFNLLREIPETLSHLTSLKSVYFVQNRISHIAGLQSIGATLTNLELGANKIRVDIAFVSRNDLLMWFCFFLAHRRPRCLSQSWATLAGQE